nr:hypothetical transcript [Hymenolepis microstoma]
MQQQHPTTSHSSIASPLANPHWPSLPTNATNMIKSEDPNWPIHSHWNGNTPSISSANPYQISSFLDSNHPPTQQ